MRYNSKGIIRRSDTTSIDIRRNSSTSSTSITLSDFQSSDVGWDGGDFAASGSPARVSFFHLLPSRNFHVPHILCQYRRPICKVPTIHRMEIGRRLQKLLRRALVRKPVPAQPTSDHASISVRKMSSDPRTCTASSGDKHQTHRLSKIVEVTEIMEDTESSEEVQSPDRQVAMTGSSATIDV